MLENRAQQSIDLYQSGKITEAQELFRKIIESNPRNEKAWLWYAYSLQNASEKIQVLQECLKFNPDSQTAQQTFAPKQGQIQPMESLRSIIGKGS